MPEAPFEDPSFDDSVQLAIGVTGWPMAAVTLLDKHEQRFKASVGLGMERTPLEHAFCRYTVRSDEVMVVPDATADLRFSANPLVTGETGIRAYAGAPLILADGSRVGAVCVLDTEARDLPAEQQAHLALIARQVVGQLQLETLISEQSQHIGELERARNELRHEASHDHLTGLLNRRGFIRELDRILAANHPNSIGQPPPQISVVFIDMDNFKMINDTLGHDAGDQVLAEFAQRLRARSAPTDLVGRIGGDEFVVTLYDSPSEHVDTVVQGIISLLEQPIVVDGEFVEIRASVGMATANPTDRLALGLIDRADRAMYTVKRKGGGRPSLWSERLEARRHGDERSVRAFVRSCLIEQSIISHYQPVCDLSTGEPMRMEALLRWDSAAPARVTPSNFIAAAESSGLIGAVGLEMLTQACWAATRWAREMPGVGVSVNVSPLQVTTELPCIIERVLDLTGLASDLLTIEVTESAVLEGKPMVASVFEAIHQSGVRISLDDFGTGYASMSMLYDLPFDELKIDRKFCSVPDPDRLAIVSAAVELGHSLGLHVIAEGIENSQMLVELTDLGCEAGQGYLLGRPASEPDAVHSAVSALVPAGFG